ncbi:MAG: HmuY family protein [Bacteroidales bacterium]|nr:HmuY family protein [Bacteroidales bacterium]
MTNRHLFLFFILVGLLSSACNGIFAWIYNPVPEKPAYGFIETDEASHRGTIFLDAHDYAKWTYVNLRRQMIDTANILMGEPDPDDWDFAIHRYDVKTNNGAALETHFTTLEDFSEGGLSFSGSFTYDTLSRIAIDMSGMMDGNVLYADSYLNPLLCNWLDVNTSQMPPIYTLSGKVYVLQLANGQYAALKFTNYMNAASTKGYVTIQYVFPINYAK